jgi:hypothetical protein
MPFFGVPAAYGADGGLAFPATIDALDSCASTCKIPVQPPPFNKPTRRTLARRQTARVGPSKPLPLLQTLAVSSSEPRRGLARMQSQCPTPQDALFASGRWRLRRFRVRAGPAGGISRASRPPAASLAGNARVAETHRHAEHTQTGSASKGRPAATGKRSGQPRPSPNRLARGCKSGSADGCVADHGHPPALGHRPRQPRKGRQKLARGASPWNQGRRMVGKPW